ncbi:hypothetical protein BJ508DRAFT_335664 [Ascobolus immersus RN42]|uniref:Uncharacterized protein n=1 Tax=Ascobolus immersus RN42 TaxID=1160509 RepID=A0A3N4HBK4_ASCIM|nr:hypothetical protein BJ508DRAFT_335664 [Ascobolus immersus RN42]
MPSSSSASRNANHLLIAQLVLIISVSIFLIVFLCVRLAPFILTLLWTIVALISGLLALPSYAHDLLARTVFSAAGRLIDPDSRYAKQLAIVADHLTVYFSPAHIIHVVTGKHTATLVVDFLGYLWYKLRLGIYHIGTGLANLLSPRPEEILNKRVRSSVERYIRPKAKPKPQAANDTGPIVLNARGRDNLDRLLRQFNAASKTEEDLEDLQLLHTESILTLTNELQSLRDQHKEAIQQHHLEKGNLETRLERSFRDHSAAVDRLNAVRIELNRQAPDMKRLEDENKRLKDVEAAHQRLIQSVKSDYVKVTEHNAAKTRLHQTLQALVKDRNELKCTKAELSGTVSELNRAKGTIRTLEEANVGLRRELQDTTEERNSLRVAYREEEATVKSLRADIDGHEEKRKEHENELAARQETIDGLRKNISAERERQRQHQIREESAVRELNNSISHNTALNQTLDSTRAWLLAMLLNFSFAWNVMCTRMDHLESTMITVQRELRDLQLRELVLITAMADREDWWLESVRQGQDQEIRIGDLEERLRESEDDRMRLTHLIERLQVLNFSDDHE